MALDNPASLSASVPRRYVSAEQIEDVVRQLRDVVSVRAVLDPTGRVGELHVLITSRRAPKQVARDIESGLHAHLDVDIDYKKISIAQTQGHAALAGGSAERLRLRFVDVGLSVSGARAEARVNLRREDELFSGHASGHASAHNQLRLIASATLRAVENVGGEDGTMVVEDLASVSLSGRTVVTTLVSVLGRGPAEELLTGSALVRADMWKAAVNATLNAVNRHVSHLFDEE